MAGKSTAACRTRRAERIRQRAKVFQLGAALGWSPDAVIAFTEALTGRPWQECGQAELELVLREYRGLVRAIQAKAARRAAREATRLRTASIGDRHAATE